MSVKESDKSNVVQSIDNEDLGDVKTNVMDYQLHLIEIFEAESKLEKNISIEPNRTINLESSTVVLLDTDLKSVQQFVENVRNIIDYIQIFDDPIKCEAYIRQIKYEVVIFIVSSHIVTPIISNIHDLQQLHTIYVYNHSQTIIEEDDQTEMNYRKVRNILKTILDFIDRIT
jgi:hypothetical protein